ncbi:MAG: hypothetical protein AAFN93_22985, partial [Bacteroidota bacterium]
ISPYNLKFILKIHSCIFYVVYNKIGLQKERISQALCSPGLAFREAVVQKRYAKETGSTTQGRNWVRS